MEVHLRLERRESGHRTTSTGRRVLHVRTVCHFVSVPLPNCSFRLCSCFIVCVFLSLRGVARRIGLLPCVCKARFAAFRRRGRGGLQVRHRTIAAARVRRHGGT